MTILTETTLRRRLRDETSAAHTALDQHVSQLDLQTLSGLKRYVCMYATALEGLLAVVDASPTRDAIADLHARSKRDLNHLGGATCSQSIGFTPDPLAVDYVVLGSRLGSAVLKKRWNGASDRAVLAVNALFSAPSYLPLWNAFCDQLAHSATSPAAANRVIQHANALFAFFDRCIPATDTWLSNA